MSVFCFSKGAHTQRKHMLPNVVISKVSFNDHNNNTESPHQSSAPKNTRSLHIY